MDSTRLELLHRVIHRVFQETEAWVLKRSMWVLFGVFALQLLGCFARRSCCAFMITGDDLFLPENTCFFRSKQEYLRTEAMAVP